ncbi:hypothetical protein CAPTEDRAFT_196750 [Capitella teleta]|uniref:Uncharacterized protein n=1 Tax=Capitella teleta TaxID=283909 RepID=R7T439_CAPTE|nr:hypothetical protein CAPTEDRAFT_196750 [Capitella teleta]|eukprot:ELT87516.1 hypothetical protein CAPTEDRAFT_196750 [Capitella teleta]
MGGVGCVTPDSGRSRHTIKRSTKLVKAAVTGEFEMEDKTKESLSALHKAIIGQKPVDLEDEKVMQTLIEENQQWIKTEKERSRTGRLWLNYMEQIQWEVKVTFQKAPDKHQDVKNRHRRRHVQQQRRDCRNVTGEVRDGVRGRCH